MIKLKFNITTFHKRVLNLNVLRLFYFLKKEYNIYISELVNKKTTYKLFNILKSPVQYKIARNQLVLVKYKTSASIVFNSSNGTKFYFKSILIGIHDIFLHFRFSLINSNCIWNITKIFRV